MKFLILSTVLIIFLAASSFAQSETRGLQPTDTSIAVTDVQIEGQNINKLLANVAYKYNVPISLEIATNEDLLKSKSLTVRLKKGTLADVLDDIVRQKPTYMWEASENTIKVFPKSDYRDPVLQTLLEVKIARFVVRKGTARLTFRTALTRSPELKVLLESYGVRPLNEGFAHSDYQSLGGDFSLDLENVTVRSILDNVIQSSKTKYWFIKRDEENKAFFLINF